LSISINAQTLYTVDNAYSDLHSTPVKYQGAVGYIMGVIHTEFLSDPLVCTPHKYTLDEYRDASYKTASLMVAVLKTPAPMIQRKEPVIIFISNNMQKLFPCTK